MEIYVVKEGDTLHGIAASFGIADEILIEDNQLVYPYTLVVGQALLVSVNTSEYSNQDKRSVYVCGYAYPFISRWVLEQTLEYLTELLVFSYGFTTDGQLIPPLWEDSWLIEIAVQYGVRPVLVLTPFGPDGRFNNRLISEVVNSEDAMDSLIESLILIMEEKGYVGLDIDFEYILAQDRDAFSEFIRRVADRMRNQGYTTSVALAPKTSADQTGLLYSGKDYAALGEAADHVFLMTYEWGYTYGPPMAVAPINQVRRVVEYALTEIPMEKIVLGVPNYGYDWPLPYEKGVSRAATLGNIEAIRIAEKRGAGILFDQIAQSPFFYYSEINYSEDASGDRSVSGTEHEVWFEDVRSIREKFNLIEQYGLYGCGYWTVMQWFRPNWLLLQDRFLIDKQSGNE